jgi:solute carrier family 1 (high affinity glutamate transporter) protein 2
LAVLDPKSSGKLGFYALTYYFCTTILAAVLGIILVQLIRPGERGNKSQVREELLGDDPKHLMPYSIYFGTKSPNKRFNLFKKDFLL